ncbi:ABC transporter ATP-binding protein [Segatella albensis]|jgi:ABC-type multidrug transport system fused ATPase/permease subunit|uniref:ABC transporter ATP-binding protein n=1 Tax=Segatella albensis TaxID=77768 RepID=UPI000480BB9E|nr:ABC transporter ATP-binding protein [Segatella albensis]
MITTLRNLFKIPQFKYTAKDLMRWLWRAWRGNRLQAVLNAIVGLLLVGVHLGEIWAVKHAIDVASGAVEGNLFWAVGFFGLLILVAFALNVSSVWIKNILGVKAQNRMQQKMLDRILRSEWNIKNPHHSGDVINRLEQDVAQVVTFLTETIPNTISVLAMFLGAFFYLFSMDWRLSLIVVAMVPIFLSVSKLYVGQMRRLTRNVRNSDSKVQSILQETIQHRMLIKTLENDSMMVERLEDVQSQLRQQVVERTKFSVFSNLVLNLGFALGYLVAFLWAALRMSAHSLTFGGMTAFLQLVNRIQGPARDLMKLIPAFVGVFTAAERLMELEEAPLEKQGEPIEYPSPVGLRLNNVNYQYNEKDGDVLQNLSFDFRPGTCTAILGETGAGKTTLVRLLLSLLKPQAGTIEIYSHHQKEKCEQLTPLHRCNISYVPQGNTLMSGTIRDNLKLGKVTATDEEMRAVLHESCADFVFDMPQGLDTLCTERGGGLSEGQAQRIAIARSLLRDRSILIFDEATSALDPDTERELLGNILTDNNKTIIFITHRSAVVEYCNQTLTLERNIEHKT